MHKHNLRALTGVAALLCLFGAGTASADPSGYAGLALGNVSFGFDSASCRSELGTSCTTDTGSTGGKLFAGVDINRNLGFEAAYEDLGTLKGTAQYSGGTVNIQEDFTAFAGDARLKLPLNPAFDIGVAVGLFAATGSANATGSGGGSASASGDTSGAHIAAFADARLGSRAALRLEYEDLLGGGENDTDITLFSLGVLMHF